MSPDDILNFWFEETDPKSWFSASEAFDESIRDGFETESMTLAAELSEAEPHSWEDSPATTLALIIALDQFPRNMYRDTPLAFRWDTLAENVSHRMIAKEDDLEIPDSRRAFVYMPLMHSETLATQERCVTLCESRLEDESTLFHAKAHRDLIREFGRFPHRNAILGRESTEAERKFLADGGYSP